MTGRPLQQVHKTQVLTHQRVSSPPNAARNGRVSNRSLGGDEPWPVIPDSGAHNGIRDGLDPAELPYINYALDEIKLSIPAENRRPVFFTDIKPPGRDDFVQDYLHGRGWDYFEAFPQGWEVRYRKPFTYFCGSQTCLWPEYTC